MISGSIVALVTPMQPDGAVDWSALDALLEWHVEAGTDGVVPMGTTGESATLSPDEHLRVVKRTVEVIDKRIPVIAGTGANATDEAIHLTVEAQRLGADAALLVTPYYNRPTQEGLVAHYRAISAAVTLPLVLYNVPPRTACDMQAETVARLAELPNVVGIKEACGDPERVGEIRNRVSEEFVVLSGEDAQTRRMLELGARGTISVTANVMPARMAEFVGAYLAGDRDRASEIDAALQPLHAMLFCESSPTPTKWALHLMGRIAPGIRLPLLPLSEAKRGPLRDCLQDYGLLGGEQ